jgi:hypothetical protein
VSTLSLWSLLGIEPTRDVATIRRAYAVALKRSSPDEDPVAFASLRQAYEQALNAARLASMAAPIAVPAPMSNPSENPTGAAPAARAAPVSPAPESSSSPALPAADLASTGPGTVPPLPDVVPLPHVAPAAAGVPSALDQLRSAFVALQQAAIAPKRPSPETLRVLLDSCLQSPALENLSIQLEFEPAVVRFFVQTLPRTQSLLEIVIEHWKWRERPLSASGTGIAALVSHADNLRRFERLQASAPRAYRALAHSPRPLLLWAQIVIFRLDNLVREALAEFRNVAPGIFDPKAAAWWSHFFTRPHVRPGLIRGAGATALTGLLLGGAVGMDHGRVLVDAVAGGLAGALAGLAIAGLWLGLIEWPRYRLSTARSSASRRLRLGWAPACWITCVLCVLCPDTPTATVGALAVAIALVSWAIVMAPGVRAPTVNSLLLRLWSAIVVNVPLGMWWALLKTGPVAPPTGAMSVVFVGTLLAFAIGQPLLWVDFLHGLTVGVRQRARLAVAAVAIAALCLLSLTRAGSDGSHLLLMCLVVIVLAHRTPAINLTVKQIRIRHFVTVVPSIVLFPALVDELGSMLRFGGVLFMSGVALSMATCLYNDWKASREGSPEGGAI